MYSRRRRPADAGQLHRAASRPVCRPQSSLAACIDAAEESLAAEDRQVGRSQPRRTRPGDGGQLYRACGGAIRRPQPQVAARVGPLKQNLGAKDNYTAGREPQSAASGRRQFERSAAGAVRLPKTAVIGGVLASEKNNVWQHGRTFIVATVVTDRLPCERAVCARDQPHNLSVLLQRPLKRRRPRRFLQ